MRTAARIVIACCMIVAAGCSTNRGIAPITTGSATLEMAVGTLNDSAGSITGTSGTYLNVVSSFRNQLGNSAYENPGNATIATPGGGTLYVCNLFSYGQNPSNIIGGTPSGSYPNTTTGEFFGMPPTYSPANQNGIGYALGMLYFFQPDCVTFASQPPVASGQYTLSAPVSVNGAVHTYTASATLPAAPTVLGPEPAPTFTSDGLGGGTFHLSPPANVTESLIVIYGPPEIATLEATSGTAQLPDGTLAAGTYNVIAIGADYPLVENGPPKNTSQAPTLAGAGGTADLTVSGVGTITE